MIKISNTLYTFIGTDDGRVIQSLTHDGSFLSRLFSFKSIQTSSKTLHKKYKIYALAQDDEFLCASGYGGEIILIDLYTRTKKKHYFYSKSTVSSLVFLDHNRLVASNVNGEVYLYNFLTQTHKKFTTTKTDITTLLYLEKENLLLVYAKDNYLTLIDLELEQILEHKFSIFQDVIESVYKEEKGVCISLKDTSLIQLSYEEISLRVALLKDEIIKKANSGYLTKLQKRSISTTSKIEKQPQSYQILQDAYKENDFKKCYEIIDKYELSGTQLCTLLEKHWRKILEECEGYAIQGDAKKILSSLGELLFIESRSDILGDLLRLSFFQKIDKLLKEKLYNSAQNILYSYIDIFGYDCEIAQKIQKFEFVSDEKIAIFTHKEDRKSRTFWWEYFHQAI